VTTGAVAPGRSAYGAKPLAGAISRLGAFAVDLALILIGYAALAAAVRFLVQFVIDTGPPGRGSLVWRIGFALWLLAYNWYGWAVSGRTPGMMAFGLRVIRADGSELGGKRALVRALVYPFSFLFFGLGLVGIVVDRRHRALHDFAAGSAVIYDWDAKAATRTLERAA
jgi:uncharacterized RDD family membrane protein YckC